jgi:hypothetical protein
VAVVLSPLVNLCSLAGLRACTETLKNMKDFILFDLVECKITKNINTCMRSHSLVFLSLGANGDRLRYSLFRKL